MHEGHRKRILERLTSDGEKMEDHEILETLLFNAIPRKNTNPIAHALISSFGTLDGVFRATFEQLKTVEGVGDSTAAYLRNIALLLERLRFGEERYPEAFSLYSFSAFLMERFRDIKSEGIEIYCLDKSSRVRFTKRYTSFEKDSATVKAEELFRFVVTQKPHALIVAHNHPDAPCAPSRQDDYFTLQIQLLCSINGIDFADHIIVGTDGFYSYYKAGRLSDIKRNINLETLLKDKELL